MSAIVVTQTQDASQLSEGAASLTAVHGNCTTIVSVELHNRQSLNTGIQFASGSWTALHPWGWPSQRTGSLDVSTACYRSSSRHEFKVRKG